MAVACPLDPVTLTLTSPERQRTAVELENATLNVPSWPVTGLSGEVSLNTSLFVGVELGDLHRQGDGVRGANPRPSTTNALSG